MRCSPEDGKSTRIWLITLTWCYQSLKQIDHFRRHLHSSPFSFCLPCYANRRSRCYVLSSLNQGLKLCHSASCQPDSTQCISSPLAPWPPSSQKWAAEPPSTNCATQKCSLISSLSLLSAVPWSFPLGQSAFREALISDPSSHPWAGCPNTLLLALTYSHRLLPSLGSITQEITLLWHGLCSIIIVKARQEVGERNNSLTCSHFFFHEIKKFHQRIHFTSRNDWVSTFTFRSQNSSQRASIPSHLLLPLLTLLSWNLKDLILLHWYTMWRCRSFPWKEKFYPIFSTVGIWKLNWTVPHRLKTTSQFQAPQNQKSHKEDEVLQQRYNWGQKIPTSHPCNNERFAVSWAAAPAMRIGYLLICNTLQVLDEFGMVFASKRRH